MANPKLPIPTDLLKTVANAKPAEQEAGQPGAKNVSKAPAPKVKASTKPVKSTMTQSRSTNRGK
jgi:hypothetical protein